MKYFPIYVDVHEQPVLVVGGSEMAAQKVRLLLKTTAQICVIAPKVTTELVDLAARGAIVVHLREFDPRDLAGCRLVYVTTGDREIDKAVSDVANTSNIPVNVVDDPASSRFITPAIVDRDPITVAIGTEGNSPVLARSIKAKLESLLPAQLGEFAIFAGSLRRWVAHAIPDFTLRRRFWERFVNGKPKERFLAGDRLGANASTQAIVKEIRSPQPGLGEVALVGAGPGDPELLTFKAMRKLQEAEVIIADRLVSAGVLECARRDAECIYVGKTPGGPSTKQSEINRLMVSHARRGKRVVRLKGGDPLIFGRATEELQALREAGIEVEIVPGITAAVACAAAIGLPLTTRDEHRSLTVITGAACNGPVVHDWQALAQPGNAFAIYMGVNSAAYLQRQLLAAGIDDTTPVVVVENGTLPNQRALRGNIGELHRLVLNERIEGPAIIYVGLDHAHCLTHEFVPTRGATTVVPFPNSRHATASFGYDQSSHYG